MDSTDQAGVVVKKEPVDLDLPQLEDDVAGSQGTTLTLGSATGSDINAISSTPAPIRYVSRRGRPPGGGYSMKTASPYLGFSTTSLPSSHDYSHSTSALSPHDLMKSSSSDDLRRFGFHGFESEKNSFRCDGCDIVFSSRDTYAMHMLLRAKNESCVALPTSAISANPENPTPREKFERELRQQAMIRALKSQAAAMTKAAAAAAAIPKPATSLTESIVASLSSRSSSTAKEDSFTSLTSAADTSAAGFGSLFSMDAYGLYLDPRHYRRLLTEYGLRSSMSASSLSAMMDQLSCAVCGELFSTKDALAMHMMFHTRTDEGEVKPTLTWKDTSTSQQLTESQRSARSPSSKEPSRSQPPKKRDTSQSGDRQLTAERVAELKRMAIESSLRESRKATSAQQTKSLQRPRSVTEEMAVTSSAQSRPLSADDVIKFTRTSGGDGYGMFFTSQGQGNLGGYKARKRLSSTPDAIRNGESKDYSYTLPIRKQARYSLDSSHPFKTTTLSRDLPKGSVQEPEREFKVCDNHVSSASGPQDSDDTSDDVSSVPSHGSAGDKEDTSHNKTLESPFLDAIMSKEAVLVPVDQQEVNDSGLTNGLPVVATSRSQDSSAIDFSLRSRYRRPSSASQQHVLSTFADRPTLRDAGSLSTGSDLFLHGASLADQERYNRFYIDQLDNISPPLGNTSTQRSHSTAPTHTSDTTSGNPRDGTVRNGANGDRNGLESNRSSPENSGVRESSETSPNRGMGEARYCPHCEILFLDVTLFHLHMGLHNVNNPWQCNTCGLVCSGRLDFNTHVLHY